MDFNPFGEPTSALLFEWSELMVSNALVGEEAQLELRLVESEEEVHPSAAAAYRGPVDVHLSHEFPNFMDLCGKNDLEGDSD